MKKYSKVVVTAIIIANIVFAAAVLAVFWHTGAEPGVLVGAWFAFTTGELWALAKIKCTEATNITWEEEGEEE